MGKPKLTLVMVTTRNGLVAGANGDRSWITERSAAGYRETLQELGTVVIGEQTYSELTEDEIVSGVQYVVLTEQALTPKMPDVQFLQGTPQEVLAALSENGVEHAALGGGPATIAQFMVEGLVDHMVVFVDDLSLEEGKSLFSGAQKDQRYRLDEEVRLGQHSIRLTYTREEE